MKLYFNPLACSLASRIAVYEGNREVEMIEVDTPTKRTSDGRDYRTVYPLGLVPALELPDGSVLTENAAVLQFLADAPADRRLQQWLCFVGTELHKWLAILLDKTIAPEVRAYAIAKVQPRLDYTNRHLAERPFLLGDYSVADGYLFAVLNWLTVIPGPSVTAYPHLAAFHARMLTRPAAKRAFDEERALYLAELNRAH
jgi:glutathione S-transferase|nr:glutathione binding-like protein [Kofleriaceae bacterium]